MRHPLPGPNARAADDTSTAVPQRGRFLRHCISALVAAVATVGSFSACAQAFPTKPVTLVIPFAAGGPTDLLGRALAQSMGASLGQTVIVENLGGASGGIAGQKVLNSPADGHMIFQGSPNELILAPLAMASLTNVSIACRRRSATSGPILVSASRPLPTFMFLA